MPATLRTLSLTVALTALAAPTGATTLPAVSIVTPADGATIPGGEPLLVTGTSAFAEPVREQRTFYLRLVEACDDLILSIEEGSERGACSHLEAFTPQNEVSRKGWTYRAVDGIPITIDATRPITGVITQYGLLNAGTGLGTLDITVTGVEGGAPVQVGSTTVSYVAVPLQDSVVPFSITPSASLDLRDLTALEVTVVARGAQIGMAYTRSNASKVTLPAWSASFDRRVEVTIDGGAPTAAALADDLATWSATLPMPGPGRHVVSARAIQGVVESARDSVAVEG